ncbi:hypothetical protein SD70_19805 [Gordoniibacillus kamchatkensis]|uniref:LysM domain-containing protein n=1 Tax=Gordoniibacillus kamchatkensis TaxID=1590651 RepID=A0ABR5AFN8_9BACL|nr:LysM peptidoglycan-binding domain-containing protein [Paenibacillus sp. VKM B-2647]KIL39513.1 hypothetical protein SD70_19805 [Paenibacillus sp. VKM B-2647]
MYYSMHQTSTVSHMNKHLHTPKASLRRFTTRFALMFAVILIAFSAGAMMQVNASPSVKVTELSVTKPSVAAATVTTIVVEQGDTLWSIAQAHAPKGANVRSYQDQLKRLNHLNGTALHVGQRLLLP